MASNLNREIHTSKARELKWRISVLFLTLFSGFTNLWGLANVERSEYYAAISKSMSINLSNFVFGAMDPNGTITVDKIPGSFWIPALFVKAFGFSTLAITIPNAIAGLASTLVITFVIKRYYGMTAGLIAGWILATTPIVVAVSRSNQPFPMYYLSIAIAIRYSIIALHELSRKNLFWTGIWIGIAFNSYMLLAWVLWPPLILGYLFTSQKVKAKVRDLLIAGCISFVTSGLWVFLVALVPGSKRPFIGGTNSNAGFDVVFGYNGIGRFFQNDPQSSVSDFRTFTPPFGGDASFFRFINPYLMGQISWLLPAALASLVFLIYMKNTSPIFLFATSYFVLQVIIFSAVQGMHQFYTSTVIFPVVILIVLAVQVSIRDKKPYFIIVLLSVSVAFAIYITLNLYSYFFSTSIIQALFLFTFLMLSINPIKKLPEMTTSVLFVAALILTPALWSINVTKYSNAFNPMAGPTFTELSSTSFVKKWNKLGGIIEKKDVVQIEAQNYTNVLSYIRSKSNSKYALTTFTGLDAAPFINVSNDLIYPMGGFNGRDPSPTFSEFRFLVRTGSIRFILANSEAEKEAYSTNHEQIRKWISENCIQDSYSELEFRLLDCK